MKQFIIGQRWISESEPELGLGVIIEVEAKTITCFFPAAKVDRRYGAQTAPLRRIRFVEGDEVKGSNGETFIVESTSEEKGIVTYHGEGKSLPESQLAELAAMLDPGAPAERRHRALLALEAAGGLALLALAGLGATQLEIRARGGGVRRSLTWGARQAAPLLSEKTDPSGPRGTEVQLRGAEIDPARARGWLGDVGRFAPGVVTLDGQAINHGLRSYLASESFALAPRGEQARLHGHVAVAAHGEQARVWLLHGGVVSTHLGLSAVPCFDAIVELGDITPVNATAADLRAAVNPHVGPLADLGVGLLMHLARRLPDLEQLATQARIVTLLLQAVRTRRRIKELMQVPMLPCWTAQDHDIPHPRPSRWLRLCELPTAAPGTSEPPVVLALYPEQDPAAHALPDAPVLRLDAAERSALTELLGLRFRAPPPRTEGGSVGRLRVGLRRALRRAGQVVAGALHLGPGAPLPESALSPDEQVLLQHLRAAGVTAAFNPQSVPGNTNTSTLTLTAAANAAVGGPTTVTVTGTATGPGERTATFQLNVTAVTAGSYTIAVTPATVGVVQGATATANVALTRTGGFAGEVTFAVEGLPTGVTGAFNPAATTTDASVLTLTAAANATVGGPTTITISPFGETSA